MNAFINYLLEANLGLCLFLVVYAVFLRNETDFRLKRCFMLLAVVMSVVFPLLHFNLERKVIPALGDFVPATWLPEVVVNANGNPAGTETHINFDAWLVADSLYTVGVLAMLLFFLIRLGKLSAMIYRASTFPMGNLVILESEENRSSFSFFQFIFIGQADQLSPREKEQIVAHERVHAEQWHSIDILLMHVLSIFFWFNPVIKIYKKIFVQLHEFEADARAVENRDVNDYCSLLAKVALLSADFKIANHFSNSLTVKRIEMMRTIKSKIRGWKIMAILLILPAFFFVVSCQDQVMTEAQSVAKNSAMALDLPKPVQAKLEEMRSLHPDKKFITLEINENDLDKTENLKKAMADLNPDLIESVSIMKNQVDPKGNIRSFVIVEYNEFTAGLSESSKQGDVYTVVEKSAEPADGIASIGTFLQQNLTYPIEAREKGIEGRVVIQFIVNTDGSLSDFTVLKGADPQLDKEALRVVMSMPHWNPGEQQGRPVRQQFILPINFNLNDSKLNDQYVTGPIEIREATRDMNVTTQRVEKGGKKVISGKVLDEAGSPLKGANILLRGTTTGTSTDGEGNFTIEVPETGGELFISFTGYKLRTINF